MQNDVASDPAATTTAPKADPTAPGTIINVDIKRRRIAIDYTFCSVRWEPTLTALLLREGLIKGARHRYCQNFLERSGHNSLDLLAISRKAQKQLCNLSKHPVSLELKAAQT